MRGRKLRPIEVDPADVPTLQQIARSKTRPWYQVQRARILLEMADGGRTQGLRIKIGRMGKAEKPALESDFDQYPEKPGDFLNIVTQCDVNYNVKSLL
jgi:hypothetical protein